MRYIRLCLLIICALTVNAVFSQKLIQSIGAGAIFSNRTLFITTNPPSSGGIAIYNTTQLNRFGLVYFPRVLVWKAKDISISAGMPVMLGVSRPSRNTYTTYSLFSSYIPPGGHQMFQGSKKLHLAIELPVVADINIGLGSTADSKHGIGVFAGAGYAYNTTSYTYSHGTAHVSSYDPFFHAGIRFNKKQRFTIGASYKKLNQWGFQVLKDL